MLRILGRRTSHNVQKVLWLLAELTVEFEQEDYGSLSGEPPGADYLHLNPNGTVPTMVHDDLVLWESNTILRYLCNRQGATSLYPEDPARRALVERWMDWQLGSLSAPFVVLYKGLVREGRTETALAPQQQVITRLMTILDGVLSDAPFMAGEEFTLADIVLGPTVYRWFTMDLARPHLPNLFAWYERLTLRSGYREYVMSGLH